MTNLLPCPFCGSQDVGVGASQDEGQTQWSVICPHCGSSCSLHCANEQDAVSQWNKRAPIPASAQGAMQDDDPTANEQWNAGCDFALAHLCKFLGVDFKAVSWDAATETVDGDVLAVIGNILRVKFGEDWGPNDAPALTEGSR